MADRSGDWGLGREFIATATGAIPTEDSADEVVAQDESADKDQRWNDSEEEVINDAVQAFYNGDLGILKELWWKHQRECMHWSPSPMPSSPCPTS